MIILIEPLCRGTSHEVFNAGFVELFCMAFPSESILYCAEQTQTDCVRNALGEKICDTGQIEWRAIDWPRNWTWWGALKGYFKLRGLVRSVEGKYDIKIVFLSFDNGILTIAKVLFENKISPAFPVLLVVHGILERCNTLRTSNLPLNPRDRGVEKKHLIGALRASVMLVRKHGSSPLLLVRKIARHVINNLLNVTTNGLSYIFEKMLPSFCMNLKPRESNNFIYVALSEHILTTTKHIDYLKDLPWRAIPLPRKIVESRIPDTRSQRVIFAVFGYGLPNNLEEILIHLQEININKPYEIRLIGNMPFRHLNYRNVLGPSKPGQMPRKEMDSMNEPVHYQLILYPEDSYQLSASGSIFEAISYSKPIIHLSNPCVNHYNSEHLPIGYCESDLESIAQRMIDIIKNNHHQSHEYREFHRNIKILQQRYSVRGSCNRLIEIYKAKSQSPPSSKSS